jgi:hypothetical protein
MRPLMEISFKLATKPAVKGTVTVVSWVSIASITTHAQNWYGILCALLVGIISVIIGAYQMPPLCASTTRSS